jgi:hypothetical protein
MHDGIPSALAHLRAIEAVTTRIAKTRRDKGAVTFLVRRDASIGEQESVMKTWKTAAVLGAAFVGLFAGSASAQDTVVAKVPFSFVVNGEEFSAGRYSASDEAGVLTIRGLDNRAGVFALTIPADGRDPLGDRPALVFTRYEKEYRLSKMWAANDEGFAFQGQSDVSRGARGDETSSSAAPQTIVLAAQ